VAHKIGHGQISESLARMLFVNHQVTPSTLEVTLTGVILGVVIPLK